MPALLEAHKLSSRAADVGFDWPEIGGLFDKLEEETTELKEELKQSSRDRTACRSRRGRIRQAANSGIAPSSA